MGKERHWDQIALLLTCQSIPHTWGIHREGDRDETCRKTSPSELSPGAV